MKVRFIRWYNALLTALLSILGYSCSVDEPEEYGSIVLYGAPGTDFIVKGTVTDEASTPLQGIKTSLKLVHKTERETLVFGKDSIETNASGNYQLKYKGWAQGEIKLIAEDIDGEANGGEYLSDTLDIDYDKAVLLGNPSNTYEIAQDIKLKKKE